MTLETLDCLVIFVRDIASDDAEQVAFELADTILWPFNPLVDDVGSV